MDPEANLKEQLALAQDIIDADGYGETPIEISDAVRLAELVLALNEWLSRGGFN